MGFDTILLVFCAVGFLAGFRRGIVYMLLFVVALFFGVFASLKFNVITATFLAEQFGFDGVYMPLLSLVITFVIVFVGIIWLAEFVTKALKMMFLNGINRLLGGVLGALAAAGIVSVAAWYVNGLDFLPQSYHENSTTLAYCLEFAPFMIEQVGHTIPFLGNLFEQLESLFNQADTNNS